MVKLCNLKLTQQKEEIAVISTLHVEFTGHIHNKLKEEAIFHDGILTTLQRYQLQNKGLNFLRQRSHTNYIMEKVGATQLRYLEKECNL